VVELIDEALNRLMPRADLNQRNKKLAVDTKLKLTELKQKQVKDDAEKELAKFGESRKLRQELSSDVSFKNYASVRTAARTLIENIQLGTPFADLTSVNAFVQIIDPGSVVKEGEQNRVLGTGALGQRIAKFFERQADGTFFLKGERDDLIKSIQAPWFQRMKTYKDRRSSTIKSAKRQGLIDVDPGSSLIEEDIMFVQRNNLDIGGKGGAQKSRREQFNQSRGKGTSGVKSTSVGPSVPSVRNPGERKEFVKAQKTLSKLEAMAAKNPELARKLEEFKKRKGIK